MMNAKVVAKLMYMAGQYAGYVEAGPEEHAAWFATLEGQKLGLAVKLAMGELMVGQLLKVYFKYGQRMVNTVARVMEITDTGYTVRIQLLESQRGLYPEMHNVRAHFVHGAKYDDSLCLVMGWP